jgi:glyceraldehyde-3-phosphate dehydrogenase (NAD(P))
VIRVGIVGMGIIGKRMAHVLSSDPDMALAGVIIRNPSGPVFARPDLPYYAVDRERLHALTADGVGVQGLQTDLLPQCDVIMDCGPSRTGAGRSDQYRKAGVRSLFCGGERAVELGPLVHPALNFDTAMGASSCRLTSCNTTALGRFVAALGAATIDRLDAVVLRCCTDTDKANKGIVNGAVIEASRSHHADDLCDILSSLTATSTAVTVPMTAGHLIQVRIQTSSRTAEIVKRLAATPRITVWRTDRPLDTALLKRSAFTAGMPWGNRYELVVRPSKDDPSAFWLSLDNEAITVPEALDVLRAMTLSSPRETAVRITDGLVGLPARAAAGAFPR